MRVCRKTGARRKKTTERMKNMIKRAIMIILLSGVCVLYSCSDALSALPDGTEALGETVKAYYLSIDGEGIAYIESREALEKFKDELIKEKTEEVKRLYPDVKSVTLNNVLEVSEGECYEGNIKSVKEIEELYLSGGKRFSFSVTVSESESKTVEFKTVYQSSPSHYEGTSVVKNEGEYGERTLVYDVVYVDGAEASRTLVSDTEVKAAQDKVVLVGTKKNTASTGKYAWPLKSVYITSEYGGRTLSGKYDYHLGVDLRASSGTYVYAADGGKVIFAGYSGSYGYLIKIEHDNGDLTYYAHLSKIDVKNGSRVYKGQYIAKSGATGNVTGAHLHFEIRKNGSTVNPKNYLPKL